MFFREHHSSNLSFGWSGGGGATIVLEDLGADAPATVTRAEFGMCAGHGVRSPTSSKVQGGSKSRSWQGRSSASQPSRCRASPRRSWAKGRCRGSGHRHFSKVQRLKGGEPGLKLSKVSAANKHLGPRRCKQTSWTSNKHLGPRSKMQTNILDLGPRCKQTSWTDKM